MQQTCLTFSQASSVQTLSTLLLHPLEKSKSSQKRQPQKYLCVLEMIGWRHHNTSRGTNHQIERKDNLPARLCDIPK